MSKRAVSDAAAADRVDFRALFSTLRRRLWLFAGVGAVIFILVCSFTLTQPPLYTATAQVLLNSHRLDAAAKNQSDSPTAQIDPASVDSEVQVVQSRSLARLVILTLKLDKDPEFNPAVATAAKGGAARSLSPLDFIRTLKSYIVPTRKPSPSLDSLDPVIDNVRAGLSIQHVGVTRAITISYTALDPAKAARLANAFAELYTRQQLEQKVESDQQVSQLLQGRIEELRKQAEADTAAVQQYRIANNLLSTTGASVTEQEISAYNQSVASAKAQAAEDQARLETARQQMRNGSSGDDVGEALSSPVISSLRAQRATVSQRVADLSGRYGPNHPEMLNAKRQLADIDNQIQAEINRVVSNLEARSQVSRQRLGSLQSSLSGARGTLAQNNRSMIKLDELQRRATTSQSVYESYLEALKRASAEQGSERSDARVISAAALPLAPSSPRVLLDLALGVVLGAFGGLIAAFVAEALSSAFTTGEEIERILGIPFLGSIPLTASVRSAGTSPLTSVVNHPHSAYAEAYRGLRTALRHSDAGRDQVVMVTSALPGEGKTTTSVSMARSTAFQGARTLLIDCDVRRRSLNKLVRTANPQVGLLEVLAGDLRLEDAIIRDPDSGAFILPVGASQRSSDDLLSGPAMDRLLGEARKSFEYIIVDTAPVLAVAETRSLATKVDQVVLAVLWRKTQQQAVRTALNLLPENHAIISGAVLTKVNMRQQSRYGYGDSTYYYNQYKHYYA